MRTLTLLAVVAIAAPSLAFGYNFQYRYTQISKTDFAVQYKVNASITDYWCAAGKFVTEKLGLPSRTRVYLLTPPPRKAGKGFSFTLDAARSSGTTGLTTFGGPKDGSMSAGGAKAAYCHTFDFDEDF